MNDTSVLFCTELPRLYCYCMHNIFHLEAFPWISCALESDILAHLMPVLRRVVDLSYRTRLKDIDKPAHQIMNMNKREREKKRLIRN